MDKPLIVILLDSSELGGIETHVFHLAKALQSSALKPVIWFYRCYGQPHPMASQLQNNNISFDYLAGSLLSIWTALGEKKPLVLHTHGYKAGIFGRLAATARNTPVVSTFHNGDQGNGVVRLYTWLDRITSRLSLNIAVSKEIACRLPVSPVCLNNFVKLPEQKSDQGNAIVFVGRLSHEKGPDLFLNLAKHLPDQQFRVYGSGPMDSHLKQQDVANVRFMGQVSSMESHWPDVGLLCISSRQEGLPMVALEAMSHGVPVAAFGLGALPELIEQNVNGWIAPQGNIKILSNLVQFWLSLPLEEKRKRSKNCLQTIVRSYSYEAVIPKVLEVYQDAVTTKGLRWPNLITPERTSPAETTEKSH
ncbi:MAG: glycosyltransferase family 4 protein [Endozoicomonas sp.]